MLKVYLFGNHDEPVDNKAFKVADKIKQHQSNVIFMAIKPNQDLPFDNSENVILMDVIEGINKVALFSEDDLGKFVLPPRFSSHDFDLGFQLKYLKKLGKLGNFKIIGIPKEGKINYKRVISIFKKLVAQDMQGS